MDRFDDFGSSESDDEEEESDEDESKDMERSIRATATLNVPGEERDRITKDKFMLGAETDSDSDSEKEAKILEQAEALDFGTTPPRHTRRMKCIAKSSRRDPKSTSATQTTPIKDKHKACHVYKREGRKYSASFREESSSYSEHHGRREPRRAPSIKVDSPNKYRSIKSVPAFLDKQADVNFSFNSQGIVSKSRSFGDVSQDANCPPSRLHFIKTFQLLVKLGDRHGRRDSRKATNISNEGTDQVQNWQIQFDQVLWLELQARHFARKIEEQDSFLLEERKNVDGTLDEIRTFHFPTKLKEFDSRGPTNMPHHMGEMSHEHPKSPLSHHELSQENQGGHLQPSAARSSSTSPLPFAPHDVNHTCSTVADHFTGPIQRKAMHIIIMLIKKVQDATSLYPTSKALAQVHPKYLEIKFVRNFETLNLWLNICKELYHKLQVIASLIDVDIEDNKTWEDWFDHGLGLTCVKTHQTYRQRSHSVKDDPIPEGMNSSSSDNPSSPKSSSLPHIHKRRSVLKETSTSRYRSFVEKNIRQIGLNGLSKRIKVALHATLWKARQALEVPAEAHDAMERQHNYGKVVDLVKFLEKTTTDDPSQKTVLASMVLHPEDFDTRDRQTHERGVWSQEFSEMGLPSFLELYLFLAKIAFDIIHESIRYKLDNKPKGDPSSMSIKQLINECKEVISGAIIGKYYYQDMTLSVLTADDKSRIEAVDNDINGFEEDVQSLLSVYFDYLQHLFQMLQRLPEASRSLKNTMEEEWQFTKEICPHTKGLEAQAGRRFCVLATGLLDSTAHFLESSLDDRSYELYEKMDKSSERVKDIALEACRNHKKLFNEIRERAAKALGFAKMLQKDLGIAAEYKVEVGVEKILRLLKKSGHVKVDCKSSDVNYEVYTQRQLATDKRQILKLLNVTCGFEDPAEADSSQNDGYIFLLNLCDNETEVESEKVTWDGEIVHVSPTVDTSIALANLQVDGLMVIACNSYQLFTQRIVLQSLLGNAVSLVNEQSSSHQTIAEALREFRDSAERLAQGILSSVKKTSETLNLEAIYSMEEGERDLVHKNYVETMLLCFNTGFEYLRELARLLSGQSKDLYPSMMEFLKEWMNFVFKNTEKGRGRRPRWSTSGLEFIVDACSPRNLKDMSEEEFQDVKKEISSCVTHIIGHREAAISPGAGPYDGKRIGSPVPMHRAKSLPGNQTPTKSKMDRKISDGDRLIAFESRKAMSDSFGPGQGMSAACCMTSDSESDTSMTSTDIPSSPISVSPRIVTQEDRRAAVIKKLEKKRNDKLFKKRIIGRVSDKKPDLASELVKIKSRRVNFKWHLGNKIGEGQFGKVYSCVNLDTGKLMAMKQIQFNPHDYSSIQDIADEITNIQCLQHESLVEYYGVEIHKSEMLIFMEYCEDGTIADVAKIGLPEEIIRVYTRQIVKAVRFVHDNGIVHRDIKGANIFVSSSGLIKLGDFGSAVRLRDPIHTMQGEICKFRGTAAFMAPEIINQKEAGYGRAADIWSLGCVVIEMATGKIPWAEFDWFAIIYRVGGGAVPGIPESLSEEGKLFLCQCFTHDPKERWTAEMLEDHTFVKCC